MSASNVNANGNTALQAEDTLMFKEAASAADVVRGQLANNQAVIEAAVEKLNQLQPRAIVTCARGSSDHAATYGKYVFESQLGILTSSASPSISSVYGSKQKLEGVLYLAISQSGASPDLLHNVDQARANGATIMAMVNVADSPLAQKADILIPLHAGPELSVAATKTYIATLSAIMHLASVWSGNQALQDHLLELPTQLEKAWALDWTPALPSLQDANNLFVISRGFGYGIAQEAALKFKETCGLHAESFSSAEVKHGPMAIVKEGFPVLMMSQEDETQSGMHDLVEDFLSRGSKLHIAAKGEAAPWRLPVVGDYHPAIEPILLVQSFYKLVNKLSVLRGYNPDQPPHLNKVTETM
ncbi:Glutamine--fructose-6-phosphate aminotransferase [isomerizing] [Sinobacterium norvegicum]|uniref:Glutamine--fructose-6-phosphate aminotransferase [isomerizing] n=1 Tax=Sinobacterium norvegicum TaxID=1641715 RepID=A0ABM9ACJ5_9GAMM|nr:SIS domain-containing protein [Sinobacterium norvegicum]CAH0990919.1 Glutamine--fructose-6-phosphate aminotransferase [isomerizing] [Sinobacterium norvegicum]